VVVFVVVILVIVIAALADVLFGNVDEGDVMLLLGMMHTPYYNEYMYKLIIFWLSLSLCSM